MLIYFNGDSNVAGTELDDPKNHSMAARLCHRFSAESISQAQAGASNDYIYDTTMAWLQQNPKPDLVVIGWTEFGRLQWYLVDEYGLGCFWEINHIGVGIPIPEIYQPRYQFYLNHIQRHNEWHSVQAFYWQNKIYNLHCMFNHLGIPHLFFNTFNHFYVKGAGLGMDWNNAHLSPYDKSQVYVEWAQEQGYQQITPGWFHFDDSAHDAWAQIMYDHIKEHNIL